MAKTKTKTGRYIKVFFVSIVIFFVVVLGLTLHDAIFNGGAGPYGTAQSETAQSEAVEEVEQSSELTPYEEEQASAKEEKEENAKDRKTLREKAKIEKAKANYQKSLDSLEAQVFTTQELLSEADALGARSDARESARTNLEIAQEILDDEPDDSWTATQYGTVRQRANSTRLSLRNDESRLKVAINVARA